MSIPMYAGVIICISSYMHHDQKLNAKCSICVSPPYFLRHCLSLNKMFIGYVAGSRLYLSSSQHWDHGCCHDIQFCLSFSFTWVLRTGLRTLCCVVSTFPTAPSPQPSKCLFMCVCTDTYTLKRVREERQETGLKKGFEG